MKLNKTLTVLALTGALALAGCSKNDKYFIVSQNTRPENKFLPISEIQSPARDSVQGQRYNAYDVITEKELISRGLNSQNYQRYTSFEATRIINGGRK